MLHKGLFCVCIQVVLSGVVLSQCIGSPKFPGEILIPTNFAYEAISPIRRIVGGNLVVDTSGHEPSGVSIVSDNLIIEGTVLVQGNLPFLGTVALEGIVPTMGSGTVAYECGSGNIGITSEAPNIGIPPYGPGLGFGGCINRI